MRIFIAVVFTSLLCVASNVHADAIGLFFEPGCTRCSTTIPPGSEATLYINALRDPLYAQFPLVYAEFRVVALPPGWSARWTPNPEAGVSLGDPFGVGVQIAFVNGLLGECINLGTCKLTATSSASDVYLTVLHHETTGNTWCYPLSPLFICEGGRGGSSECISCVPNFQAIINGLDCVVGIQPSCWSNVKDLYRKVRR